MIYPSADTLEKWGSKYSLVVLAAKRAKQLKSGAPPLIQTNSRNPLTIALEEIAAGKVHCKVADHDILPKSTGEAEVAQLLAIPTLSADEEEGAEPEAASEVLTDEPSLVTDEDEEEEFEEEDEEEEAEEEDQVGILEDDEEDEHESPFVSDADEDVEGLVDEEEEAEAEPIVDDIDVPGVIPDEEPKPKARRGRKPKAEAIAEDEAAGESEE